MEGTEKIIRQSLTEHLEAVKNIESLIAVIARAAQMLHTLVQKNGHLFLCGNGGSAADAQHWSGEWRGRFEKERRPLKATALSVDTSTITAVGNDYGYDEVFARQLRALGQQGDVLVAISTSGNSPNIIRAIEIAKEIGIATIGLTGKDGGKMKQIADCAIIAPSSRTPRIQEIHEFIMHTLCELVDEQIGK